MYDGRHQPLVPEDRFNRVQRRLDAAAVDNRRAPRNVAVRRTSPAALLRHDHSATGSSRTAATRTSSAPTTHSPTDAQQKSIRAESFDASFALALGSLAFALRRHHDADQAFGVSADSEGDLDAATKELADAVRAAGRSDEPRPRQG